MPVRPGAPAALTDRAMQMTATMVDGTQQMTTATTCAHATWVAPQRTQQEEDVGSTHVCVQCSSASC